MPRKQPLSSTGNSDHFWFLKGALSELGYPVDTVRLEIGNKLSLIDRKNLDPQIWGQDDKTSLKRPFRGGIFRSKASIWQRETDDLRVISKSEYTVVEVSLPRFHGHKNCCLHRVPQDGLPVFMSWVASELLPATTIDSRAPWVVTRLDIAIDFQAKIHPLIKHYRDEKVPGGQKAPVPHTPTSMKLQYKNMNICLYGKVEEAKSKGTPCPHLAESTCRFEVQLKGAKALEALWKELKARSGVRIRVPGRVARSGNAIVSMDRIDLLRFGLDVMSLLAPPKEKIFQASSLRSIAIFAMSRYPDIYLMALNGLRSAALKRALTDVSSVKFAEVEMDLLKLSTGICHEDWRDSRPNIFGKQIAQAAEQ